MIFTIDILKYFFIHPQFILNNLEKKKLNNTYQLEIGKNIQCNIFEQILKIPIKNQSFELI